MKRYLIIFEGRIQGVGFRAWCQKYAVQYHCTGWVRNMSNGMVEMQIQGDPDWIRVVLAKIINGNTFIRVDHTHTKEIALQKDEKRFETRYY